MSDINDHRGGPRIGPDPWQVTLGVGGPSSPGPIPVSKKSKNRCRDCGHAMFAHDKERVRHENGYSFDYQCPGGDGR